MWKKSAKKKHLLIVAKPNIALTLLLFFVSSCTSHEKDNLSTYVVSRKTFENVIVIDGFAEPLQSTTASCPPYVDGVIVYLIEDGTFVKEGDIVAVVEVQELQNTYDRLLIDKENAEVGLNRIRADLAAQYALLEAQVRNNEAETKIAELDSLQLKYSAPNQAKIKELELKRVTIEKERHEKKLKALEIIQQSEIRRRELGIQQVTNRVQSAKNQLDGLVVRAAKDGLAIRATNWITQKKLQVGDPVWDRMSLVNIPELSVMKIIIKAPEIDYKFIDVNDSVVYTFDAMPDNIAWGKITAKSPVGQYYGQKLKFFDIEASIDSTLAVPDPGFSVSCRVISEQVKDTLVVPQIAVFEEDSMKVVYVKTKKHYEMRQVLTGLSSSKEVIITSGLQEKDIISLTRPPVSLVKGKLLLPKKEKEEEILLDSLKKEE